MFNKVEADDVIAYVTKHSLFENKTKIILSSDMDFVQLLDNKTIIMRPAQEEVLNSKRALEKLGINPNNFALAKAIVGDKSDNVEGVPGIGFSTLSKRFPILQESTSVTFDEIFEACQTTEKRMKCHDSILEHRDLIKENYKIVQLASPLLSPQIKLTITETIENFSCQFPKMEVKQMMLDDGFSEVNLDELFQYFVMLVNNYQVNLC